MESSKVVGSGSPDVTIYLVEKLSVEQAGSTSNKRRRISKKQSEVENRTTLGKVKAKASRLRQCSTYFQACMSERWAKSKAPSQMEFHLEAQTDVRCYEDCFSRMHCLFKPIDSVAGCIELLKVASQIGYQDVMDIGVKYLAAAPWSYDEEKLVRQFCSSAHLVPFDSLSDLNARLHDFPLAEEEKQEHLSCRAKKQLTRYLRCALASLSEVADPPACQNSRVKFARAFHMIVSGSEPDVCDSVRDHALTLLRQEACRVLSGLQIDWYDDDPDGLLHEFQIKISSFTWLFEVARKANAAQIVVEVLVNDTKLSDNLCDLYDGYQNRYVALKMWARAIYSMFQDVLEGKLFLTTLQRVTLLEWHWLFDGGYSDLGTAEVAELLTRFITTLPQKQQEQLWRRMDTCKYEGSGGGPLLEAHTMWVSHMVTRKAQPQQDLTASSDKESSAGTSRLGFGL